MLNLLRQPLDHNSFEISWEKYITKQTLQVSVTLLTLVILFSCGFSYAEETNPNNFDFTSLSLEELTESDIVSNAHFAQQLVDASSAVSVVTAKDIERFGYRTIGEILDSMRGIHVSQDGTYGYLGGRGYGAPGEYAGRIMILIDGYSAADNIFNQIYINNDGYLDTALIDRVEYAPGPGSAIYGNNAFLGVVNIITRKGRDFDGLDTEVIAGPHHDHEARITWGKRFENGAEWLISASGRSGDDLYPSRDPIPDASSNRTFLKVNYQAWSIEAASAAKRTKGDYTYFWDDEEIYTVYRGREQNRFVNIHYESDFINRDWKTTSRLYYGDYFYDYLYEDSLNESNSVRFNGEWFGIDSKLIYLGAERHRVLFGIEYHIDSKQDASYETLIDAEQLYLDTFKHNGDIFSIYGEDTITFTPSLSASIGGRYDRRNYDSLHATHNYFNPRLSLFYEATNELSLKFSYGQAGRFEPISDADYYLYEPSRIRTTELVMEHEKNNQRTLASLYRYHVDRLPDYSNTQHQNIIGAELESEWMWPGEKTLRFSYTWQRAKDDQNNDMPNVPRNIGKLQFSYPLQDQGLRASLAMRYVGQRNNLDNTKVDGYTVTDLTFTSIRPFPDASLTLAIRNLFNTRHGHVTYYTTDSDAQDQEGRALWLRLKYSPR